MSKSILLTLGTVTKSAWSKGLPSKLESDLEAVTNNFIHNSDPRELLTRKLDSFSIVSTGQREPCRIDE